MVSNIDMDISTISQRWQVMNALHGFIAAELERQLQQEHSISNLEFSVMVVLSAQNGDGMRVQALSQASGLSASATTRLVDRLEENRLLARSLCDADRRGIQLRLTQKGQSMVADFTRTYEATLQSALAAARKNSSSLPFVQLLLRSENDDVGTPAVPPGQS